MIGGHSAIKDGYLLTLLFENLNQCYDCISSSLLNIVQIDKYLRDPTAVCQ